MSLPPKPGRKEKRNPKPPPNLHRNVSHNFGEEPVYKQPVYKGQAPRIFHERNWLQLRASADSSQANADNVGHDSLQGSNPRHFKPARPP